MGTILKSETVGFLVNLVVYLILGLVKKTSFEQVKIKLCKDWHFEFLIEEFLNLAQKLVKVLLHLILSNNSVFTSRLCSSKNAVVCKLS